MQITVYPLVDDTKRQYRAGWCSYSDDFADLPEVEYMCGGINSKTHTAAAIWRQGNLLHFGFEQSPAEMNETGQALLLNSIAYISRFTQDRPIVITPSVFAGPVPPMRTYPQRIIAREDRDLADLNYYLSAETLAELRGKNRNEHSEWFARMRSYLGPADSQKLGVDKTALSFGAPPDKPEFFERLIDVSRTNQERRAEAGRLLARYAPDGPGEGASAEAWQQWWQTNKPYLFYSDAGGYRWYIDPLAKKRGISTTRLRGPARADQP
ncbi:MAG: hypothetical protein AB1705_22025 [Verrucomicrobiota bacterium]